MRPLTEREKWDIQKVLEDKSYYACLPERQRTAAVSMVAVFSCGHHLEYVPEAVLNRDICRMALKSDDADCSILSYIPYKDIQKEGIRQFSGTTPAFVLYSFADITDAQMALDAVKADAYCLQLVPGELLTKDLCREALKNPNADEKVSRFVRDCYPGLQKEQTPNDEKKQLNTGVKMKL